VTLDHIQQVFRHRLLKWIPPAAASVERLLSDDGGGDQLPCALYDQMYCIARKSCRIQCRPAALVQVWRTALLFHMAAPG
jgi:hypothetical protein